MHEDIKNTILSEKQIADRICELASQISLDYIKNDLLLIGILNGSFIFLADLIRKITIPLEVDFISFSSYKKLKISDGNIDIRLDIQNNINGKDIILVEDIIDTGFTIHKSNIVNNLISKGAKTVKICALLDKQERRKINIDIDYVGFVISDEFVVGYGMDFAGLYRNLPFIGVLKSNT